MPLRVFFGTLVLLAVGCQKGEETKIVSGLDEINGRLTSLEDRISRIETLAEATVVAKSGIAVELPSAMAEDGAAAPTVQISLSRTEIFINGEGVEPGKLQTRLETLAAENPGASLVLAADAKVPHERVVEIMHVAKRAGLKKIALAVATAESTP